MKTETIDPTKHVLLLAKLFPDGVPPGLATELAKEGALPTYFWRRFRGIGPKAINKLRAMGLVSTPESDGMEGLSVRLVNALYNAGIDTGEKASTMIKSGALKPGEIRNYGEKSHAELCRSLGLAGTAPDRCRCDKCGQLLPPAAAFKAAE